MAKLSVTGLGNCEKMLNELEGSTRKICGMAIYDGAAVVADKVKQNLQALKTDTEKRAMNDFQNGKKLTLSPLQKQGLIDGMGISKMDYSGGGWNVQISFHGYNKVITKKYPRGQPNILIARSLNKGTSYLNKQPFMTSAVSAARAAAEAAMEARAETEINKITGGST